MIQNNSKNYTPEEISRIGDQFYFSDLRERLEKNDLGKYVVIEVESKDYFVDKDLVVALEKARKKHPAKIFHIIQIGTLDKPSINYRKHNYAWIF